MRVLRAVDRVGSILHPTEILAGMGEIFSESVGRFPPLRALIARLAETQLAPCASGDVDNLQSFVRMVGVAQNSLAALVWSDVPGVVFGDS